MSSAQRVQELTTELLDLGYRSFQIEKIYQEALGYEVDAGSSLSTKQFELLCCALEDYIRFAKKCLKTGK